MQFMKRIESLLKIAGIKFEFNTWKSVFTNVRFRPSRQDR